MKLTIAFATATVLAAVSLSAQNGAPKILSVDHKVTARRGFNQAMVGGMKTPTLHNAMWESNHLLMFGASLEWLKDGAVGGTKSGVLKLGYPKS